MLKSQRKTLIGLWRKSKQKHDFDLNDDDALLRVVMAMNNARSKKQK